MSKMDGMASRTPADIERRYNFGKSFAEILGIANDAQTHAYKAEEEIKELNWLISDSETGLFAQLNAKLDTDRLVSQFNMAANEITITSDGFNLAADGTITSKRGKIGGWDISEASIFKNTVTSAVKLVAPTSANDYALTIASLTNGVITDMPFYLQANGRLFSKNADIQGKITATEGNIGGWDIVNNSGEKSIKYIDYSKYRGTGFQPPNSGIWGIAVGYTNDADWSTAPFRVDHYGNMYADSATVRGGIECIGSYGCKAHLTDGQLYMSSDTHWMNIFLYKGDAPTIQAKGSLALISDIGVNLRCDEASFVSYSDATYAMTKCAGDYFQFKTINKKSFHLSPHDESSGGYLDGTWSASSAIKVTSDGNYKNSIEDMPEAYGVLFDNLRPIIHKYNDGTSDRYHVAFIAQEVDEAREKAGIPRKDFAAVCIDNAGLDTEKWYLRYSEFIPINTSEIQKLKARMNELEKKLEGTNNG